MKNSYSKIRGYSKISWIVVIILAVAIFLLSSQTVEQSSSLSRFFTKKVLQILPTHDLMNFDISEVNNFLRKSAHFFLYLLTGYYTSRALYGIKRKSVMASVLALLLCALFAATDEVHQLFVGRGGQFSDVLLDSFGSLVGIGIATLRRNVILMSKE